MPVRDWNPFFEAQRGRDAREVLQEALALRGGEPGSAVDLGCGEGTETRFLLNHGWRVLAIDGTPGVDERVRSGAPADQLDRLRTVETAFETLGDLPAADLVYSGFALPFCAPDAFPRLWHGIRVSMEPAGWFVGELFGPHDDWALRPGMNFHDRTEVDELLDGLVIESLNEEDRAGQSFYGPKHWHVFHIIARLPLREHP